MTPTSARALVALSCLAGGLAAGTAHARRLPAPGGKLTLALPVELVGPTAEAHVYAPILESVTVDGAAERLARPTLKGFPRWRSSVVTELTSQEGGKIWKVGVEAQPVQVGDALARCLRGDGTASWPADVLRARGVTVDVTAAQGDVTLRFSAPVGPVPELLAGCALRTPQAGPTGSYTLVGPGLLRWRNGAFGPPALLGSIELAAPGARADLVAGGADVKGAGTLLAPFPDVVLLLQSAEAKRADVLGLDDAAFGARGFRQALRADLLAAAYAQGRGAAAEGLLPPGVAPARPLPEPQGPERLAPLALTRLPPDAPRVLLLREEGDALVDGVVERLAVILRNRGRLADIERASAADDAKGGLELLRWRPPTRDPALALLSLAGRRKDLVGDPAVQRALSDPQLLSASQDERVAAALGLERAWMDAGLAIPLLTADRWYTVDPDLRGVVLREDGVPLLFDAYFAGGR
ncbi:MAG: hypothetical protein HYS27_28120 [Deltaproteobacteria bacterium]|nr:hypothetical protein [Deltaproteobacteria bacterium]